MDNVILPAGDSVVIQAVSRRPEHGIDAALGLDTIIRYERALDRAMDAIAEARRALAAMAALLGGASR